MIKLFFNLVEDGPFDFFPRGSVSNLYENSNSMFDASQNLPHH